MADISQLRLPTPKKSLTGNLSPVTFSGTSNFNGSEIWTDGEHIYLGCDYVLDESTLTWTAKTWSGLVYFSAENIWTDGENIYYSYESTSQYVLDKATSTWSRKTWTGLTDFEGKYVWTDGDNVYCSNGSSQYVLNKATSTWTQKTWTSPTNVNGNDIWTDGENIYYSYYSTQYVLNKATSTWTQKTWTGYTSFNGRYVWTDGDNVYYSSQYVLDKSTSTWTQKTWTGLTSFDGYNVWSDLEGNYYCSINSSQYQFDAAESGAVSYENYNIKDTVARQNDASLDSRVTALEQGGGGGDVPVASDTTLGVVKVGESLSIDGYGTLNVNGGNNILAQNKWSEKNWLVMSVNPSNISQVKYYFYDESQNDDADKIVAYSSSLAKTRGYANKIAFIKYIYITKDPDNYAWNELTYSTKSRYYAFTINPFNSKTTQEPIVFDPYGYMTRMTPLETNLEEYNKWYLRKLFRQDDIMYGLFETIHTMNYFQSTYDSAVPTTFSLSTQDNIVYGDRTGSLRNCNAPQNDGIPKIRIVSVEGACYYKLASGYMAPTLILNAINNTSTKTGTWTLDSMIPKDNRLQLGFKTDSLSTTYTFVSDMIRAKAIIKIPEISFSY